MNTCQKVIFFLLEYIFIQRNSRSNQFRNAPFYNIFCQLGIFQLFTNRNPLTCPYQFRKIGVKRMKRESCKFNKLCRAVCPPGQCNTQDLGSFNGIASKSFIEIPHPEQQHCIRMFPFEVVVLFHQRWFYHLIYNIFRYFCHFALLSFESKSNRLMVVKKVKLSTTCQQVIGMDDLSVTIFYNLYFSYLNIFRFFTSEYMVLLVLDTKIQSPFCRAAKRGFFFMAMES